MLGPVVNAVTVVICSLLGCFAIRGIPERFEETIKKAIGIAIIYIGIRGAMENRRPLLLIMSVVTGALLGEFINIDKRINRLGLWAERKLYREKAAEASGGKKSFAKGFVSASILFCTGSMVIVGSLQSGLQGNHEILFTKSILDGTISIVFGASLGIGVLFSAIPVFIVQGGIALLSRLIKDYLTPEIITEMSATGNLIVAAIGINFVCLPEGKEIKVANLIPAIFIPWAYLVLEALVKG
ncbi:MAG: DUF554 domain-containing protein [Spirochaetaceae bacterium]|jgi:uncharacterized membrane protein YqgA involved in biofilm formation|nr:DUF554 domain-containing protein [Spirochaetaceae bacterium]